MSKRFVYILTLSFGLLVYGITLAVPMQGNSPVSRIEKVRAFHFVLRLVSLKDARHMVDLAQAAGFNTAQIIVTDGVLLKQAPWQPLQGAWSKRDFKEWVEYARGKGIETVPEFKLLTHQEKFFQNRYPDLLFNRSTYDPRNIETYKQVFSLLDEIIELIQPRAIHIGHDEMAGWLMRRAVLPDKFIGLQPGEKSLPAELFLQDVLRIHGYLKERGIETWMWGDMLLSPDEFPNMTAKQLKGGAEGYGKSLRDKLPRDIVICDWHYGSETFEFPSVDVMTKEGFRVIGATFFQPETILAFSRYAAQHGAYGMIATTWFYVQRKEWDVVERIIRESGETFRKDFPDAKH